ncbi:thiamine pyrophosphate-dependent enzyme [Alteribacillus bidgolensis]|uniref:Acetolactate synthase-1/2/3 large subunit n=1 Tax=Alteribacillus bidgolensis TaxID=930129 RepID=A0A1G8CNP3_9BACI|nr:thiamine pyrophosphate-dependent enzyme [Alteribacillus bidgolensis]SDH46962.1 acetolactate synthase-1/2/3 large subunit [Alteribacillus bidgolensis]
MNVYKTVAAQIVDILKREAVDRVFSVPGESFLDVMNEIYLEEAVDFVSCRHEGGASFMAEAYGKLTGRPGVVMATRGVGGSNLSIGVHTAHQDSTPMVVFLGQVDRKFRGREGFQEIELDRMFSHVAKWTYELTDPNRANEMISRAFRIAQSGRPGPVVVSLPADVLEEESIYYPQAPYTPSRPAANQEEIKKALHLLKQSKRPLIIAGGGVLRSKAEKELLAFVQSSNIPIIASFRRHDIFPNNHRLYAGHTGLGTFPEILNTMRQADTVLAIGTRLSEITTQSYSIFQENITLIHIDIDPDTLGKVYPPQAGIVADASQALTALLENKIKPNQEWEKWAIECRQVYDKATAITEHPNSETVDIAQIIQSLQEVLSDDAVITNDAGNFAAWLHNYYSFNEPKTYAGPTSGAMGYGLPAGIAAKMVFPEKTVVSLSGDGGFMMTVQELETAVRHKVPIIAVVFNNSMYGTIRMHQEKVFPHHVIGTSLNEINFSKLAEAMGVYGQRINHHRSFKEALQKTIQHEAPALIEVMCHPDNISVLSNLSDIHKSNK